MLSAGLIKRFIALPVLLTVLVLTGCAHTLRHEVTVFHDWTESPAATAARTYRFEPRPAQADSLKFKTYERVIATELERAGFSQSEKPNLTVSFDYTNNPSYIRYIDRGPAFSPYFGFGTAGPRGSVYFSAPLAWGWPYYGYQEEIERYQRVLSLEITDLLEQPPKRVYEATARSTGSQPAMAAALPLLMRAILADFPGRSGVPRQVDIDLDDKQDSGLPSATVAPAVAPAPTPSQ